MNILPTDEITRTLLQEERRRLYQRIEELQTALLDARNEALEEAARLHEQLYVAHDDAMTAIVKYRDAIRAMKAVLGKKNEHTVL